MPDITIDRSEHGLTVVVTELGWEMPKEYALSVSAAELTMLGYGGASTVSAKQLNPNTWELKYLY